MTHTITNHRIDEVPFKQAADHGGALIKPTAIVLHYTAGGSAAGASGTLTAKDDTYVSAHLLIDRDGTVTQMLDFRTIAYHAGPSALAGRTGCNAFTLGIELVNPGYRRPGFLYTNWPTITAAHKSGGPKREWFMYSEEQVASTAQVCAALMHTYESITQVVGHDDITNRKTDPGPAFPWTLFRTVLESYKTL